MWRSPLNYYISRVHTPMQNHHKSRPFADAGLQKKGKFGWTVLGLIDFNR